MKFWLSLVAVRETEQLPELARFAEELGFHGLMVGDHLIWPAHIQTPIRTPPTARSSCPPIPLAGSVGAVRAPRRAHAAAALRLQHLSGGAARPAHRGQEVATAAVLTGIAWCAAYRPGGSRRSTRRRGWISRLRGRRLDETLVILRKLLTGAVVKHDGPLFRFEGIMRPRPREAGAHLVRGRGGAGHAPCGAQRRLAAAADDGGAGGHRARRDAPHAPRGRTAARRLRGRPAAGRARHSGGRGRAAGIGRPRPRRHRALACPRPGTSRRGSPAGEDMRSFRSRSGRSSAMPRPCCAACADPGGIQA